MRVLDFYRLSYLGCPDFVGTYRLWMLHTTMLFGYTCIEFGTYFNLLVETALESCETRERLCFRGIYNGGLWEDDLHVYVLLRKTETQHHVSFDFIYLNSLSRV